MDRQYLDAFEKNVGAFVVYGKTADHKLYLESSYTTQAPQADVERAFAMGLLLVKVSTTAYKPVCMAANKVSIAELSGSPAAATITEFAAKALA